MRVKTPTVIQMEAVECGAASLGIILGYFGKYVPLEQLRIDCGVSRDGSNALKMVQTAEKYGLIAKGFKKSIEELSEMTLPVVLLWEFNHFLVLEGFSKEKVYLNDPSMGPRTVSFEDFDRSFTGVVIAFEKGPAFKQGGKPPPFYKDLFQRMKPASKALAFLILTGFFLLIPGLAIPVFMRIFIDDFLVTPHLSWTQNFLLAVGLATVLGGTLNYLRQKALLRLNTNLSIVFSSQFLWHLLKLPVSFYTQRFSGEIAYRMNFNDTVTQILTSNLAPTFVDLFLTSFYAACLFLYDAGIGFLALLTLAANILFMLWIQRSRADAYSRLQQEYGKSVGFSIGVLQQIDTIKAIGIESSVYSNLTGYFVKNTNAYQVIGKKDSLLATVPFFFQALAVAGVLSYGSWRVIKGDLTVGMLMAIYLLLQGFLQPIIRFVNFGQTIQNMKIDLGRLNDVLKNKEDDFYKERKEKTLTKPKLEGFLEFKNISFGYIPLDAPLIENLSFRLTPGKRIALVGPSGSGKSTIAKLCCSLYAPWTGEILYDGKRRSEIPQQLLQNSLSSVDQEIFLFEGTIWENLTLWDETLSEEVVYQAAKDALIHDEILLRSDLGYQAVVSEGGKNLSGGQKQRLEIARALLRNPSLLIMDEATSSLDSEIEKKISDNVSARGCSCVMIAHRLSTIQDCNEILVLDKGTVVQRGTHLELKEVEGIYRTLVLSEVGKL